jgi:ribosomal-protein-serine acetyltransferase
VPPDNNDHPPAIYGAILNTETLRIPPDIKVVPVSPHHARPLSALIKENLPHLHTFLPALAALSTVEAAQAHLKQAVAAAEQGELYEWHIFRGDELCGAIRVSQIERDNRKASLSCYLAADRQGAGVATASLRAVIAYCFKHLNLNRVEWRCASENMASQRLAKRLDFSWEGMLRQAELLDGVFVDHFVYSLLRQDASMIAQSA